MSADRQRAGRRRLTLLGGLIAACGVLSVAPSYGDQGTDEHSSSTPVDHFVFLLQENHTFDNYFGTRPGVDGIPEGTCMPVSPGYARPCVEPYWIGGKPVVGLGHNELQFEREYNEGRMDGFIEANSQRGRDGSMAMGYYDDRDLPYYWNVADEYVLFDRFFSSAKGGSVANHLYAVAGVPGRAGAMAETVPPGGWGAIPTIFDRLQDAGVSWKFYIENYDPTINFRTRDRVRAIDRAAQFISAPVLAFSRFLDNPELNKHIVDLDEYYSDAQSGALPAVSYIVPSGQSEHPPGRIQAGEELVRSLINELMRSPLWDSSAFLWTYDDWGGWYDHVPPPQVDRHGYGFRVPALLVSPYARRGFVDHTTNDLTSVLAFIETNWNLEPLASRDRRANDLMEAFDFSSPRPAVILGTDRSPPVPVNIDTRPVYAAYGAGVCAFLLLTAFAARRTRQRGIHPKALSSANMVEGRELP
jgi:phospholipase C